jgi:hypothetical protein
MPVLNLRTQDEQVERISSEERLFALVVLLLHNRRRRRPDDCLPLTVDQ